MSTPVVAVHRVAELDVVPLADFAWTASMQVGSRLSRITEPAPAASQAPP